MLDYFIIGLSFVVVTGILLGILYLLCDAMKDLKLKHYLYLFLGILLIILLGFIITKISIYFGGDIREIL